MVVRIWLPKGVVIQESLKTIKRIMDVTPLENCLSYINDEVHCYLLKHRDIPHLVHNGILDIGITSSEWLAESNLNSFHVHKKLDWCDTRISFIAPIDNFGLSSRLRIATEFPNITKNYADDHQLDVEVIYRLSGSTEALIPCSFAFGVECIETGDTLKANNLVEVKKIIDASIVVVTKDNYSPKVSLYLELIKNKSEVSQ